ncbi:hypothetical protein C6Y14_34260 [Streptomyces dioscori]|uniref:Uncharacterized protein n=1 Tax=Streptomyces dioscori TaxID=2109333 RepID=A0A2P8PYK9_9ACTN|nr:hypothetical protein C6Y14_34260 [Streptomyces dioscori]
MVEGEESAVRGRGRGGAQKAGSLTGYVEAGRQLFLGAGVLLGGDVAGQEAGDGRAGRAAADAVVTARAATERPFRCATSEGTSSNALNAAAACRQLGSA